jgi:acyl-CoA synthetase (AMP-forming)/AMP-acid ligase II
VLVTTETLYRRKVAGLRDRLHRPDSDPHADAARGGVAREYDFEHLRLIASVGEPLNPEAVVWGQSAFGLPIHDNWWQTETGGIMIANYPAMDIKPGSMGRPLPGVEAAILRRDDKGRIVVTDGRAAVVQEPGGEGELALRPGWPSMFRGYLGDEARYRERFAGGAFWELDAPVARVCGAEVPIPYAKHLEDAALPQVAGILQAARGVVTRGG